MCFTVQSPLSFFFYFQVISLKQNKLIDYAAAETDIYRQKEEFANSQIPISVSGSSYKIKGLKDQQSCKEFLMDIDKRLVLLENNLEKLSMCEVLRKQIKQSLTDILKDLLCIREM
jgi:hypothetical protein